jgi:hypothetical protein
MKTIKILSLVLISTLLSSCAAEEEEICVEGACYEIIDVQIEQFQASNCWSCYEFKTTYYVKDVCSGEFVYFKSKGRNWGQQVGNTVYCGFGASNWKKSYFNN